MQTLNSFNSIVKDLNYFGFKCKGFYCLEHWAAYELRFVKDKSYFRLYFTYEFLEKIKDNPELLLKQIETMIHAMPEFKKTLHHKEFYNKFDKMLHD